MVKYFCFTSVTPL